MFDADRSSIDRAFHQPSSAMACTLCSSYSRCVSASLAHAHLGAFERMMGRERRVQAGQSLYRMEDPFTSLYVVREGALKVEVISADGARHVSGFYYPGDLVAIESIGDQLYASDCIALEDALVCRLPYDPFMDLATHLPTLAREFANHLSKRIRLVNQINIQRRTLPADRRLFTFLCDFCARHKANKAKHECVNLRLPMSKGDIASYLGIVPESLSRAFAALERKGFVQRNRDHVKLIRLADDCQA